MSKIRIKNFGPIKEGLKDNNGWIDVKRVSVFIGNQGSGKSTVAKLLSTMTWMEKALVRGDFSIYEFNGDVVRRHCSYQNVDGYFKDNTDIEYQGKAYTIRYIDGDAFAKPNLVNGYSFPKIMYVPSERNLVGSVRNVMKLKGLPSTLYTFADEFFDALENLTGVLELPINDAILEFENLTKVVNIKGLDYKVELPVASSGFQSFVPLYIVTDYLAKSLDKRDDLSKNQLSIDEERRLAREVQDLMDDPNLSPEIKRIRLRQLSAERNYSSFVNIVEEPEQNLFPTSQRKALNSMLSYCKRNEDDKLVMTTHSPYLINYLTLAVKAYSLLEKMSHSDVDLKTKLHKIVPIESAVNGSEVVVYELDEKTGTIARLKNYNGMPSDDNALNERLGETNEFFAQLLEIQQQL